MSPSSPDLREDPSAQPAAAQPAWPPEARGVRPAEALLLLSVLVVAGCGLVYELCAGALSSYLLGDSVLQFSTVIGVYLFAMGVGSWLSKHVEDALVDTFVRVELMVGLIGGAMPAGLFLLHSVSPAPFRVLLYGWVGLIGVLVGLEIPLVMRILRRHTAQRQGLKDLVAQVLTFDYLGALAVSVAFPLVLVPHLGLARTGFFFGLLNALVALWACVLFRPVLLQPRRRMAEVLAGCALLLAGLFAADRITAWSEDRFYADHILYKAQSDYQRVVITEGQAGIKLFLNGNLQFSERDEYRYHEALVHPAMSAHPGPRKVLVLGGGDGLAVREVLRYPSVESVTLVDLDPHITRLFRDEPRLRQLNRDALRSPKVQVVNADAFGWLEQHEALYDVIVVDFPDPSNFAVGKLYTLSFDRLLASHLSQSGFAVVQTTSPLVARRSFWTVATTLEAAGLQVMPYHAHVPSFGEWGFIMASHRPWPGPRQWPTGLRFLTPESLPVLFQFPADMSRVPTEVNRLSNQVLVREFEEEWGRVAR